MQELLAWLDGRRRSDDETLAQRNVRILLTAVDSVRNAEERVPTLQATIATASQRRVYENRELREWEQDLCELEAEMTRQREVLDGLGDRLR